MFYFRSRGTWFVSASLTCPSTKSFLAVGIVWLSCLQAEICVYTVWRPPSLKIYVRFQGSRFFSASLTCPVLRTRVYASKFVRYHVYKLRQVWTSCLAAVILNLRFPFFPDVTVNTIQSLGSALLHQRKVRHGLYETWLLRGSKSNSLINLISFAFFK